MATRYPSWVSRTGSAVVAWRAGGTRPGRRWSTLRASSSSSSLLGQERQRELQRDEPLGVGPVELERADRRALELLAVGVAEVGDELADVGAAEHSISNAARSLVAPQLLEPVDRDRPRLGLDRLSPARLLVRALAVDLHGRVGGRALHQVAGRQLERVGRDDAGLDQRPLGVARSRTSSRAARPSGRSSAGPSGSAASASPRRPARAAGRWRTGRACRRGRRAGARRGPAISSPPHLRDDVVGGDPSGLGVEQHAGVGPRATLRG